MAYYSDETINKVMHSVDIADIIGERIPLKRTGVNYMGPCPFHADDSPSLSVVTGEQYYHCFGCGAAGNVFRFLMEYEQMEFTEAVEYIAARSGIELRSETPTGDSSERRRASEEREKIFEINKAAAAYFHYILTKTKEGQVGRFYLDERKISGEVISRFALGYIDHDSVPLSTYLRNKGYPDELIVKAGLAYMSERYGMRDFFRDRVMIPIINKNNRCIGFGGRILAKEKVKGGEGKYKNTPDTDIFKKGENVYALNLARKSRRSGLILCEGYMDVISMHQAGFDNAVAALGTAFTEQQAALLKRFTRDAGVYLAMDSDMAGRTNTIKAIHTLRKAGVPQRVIDMKPYKDPDEFIKAEGADAFQERIDRAQTGRMFEIEVLSDNVNMHDPEQKTIFMHKAAAVIHDIEDVTERSNYIDAVCETYRLDRDVLKRAVSESAGNGDIIREESPGSRPPKADGPGRAEALLVSWMIYDPGLIKELSGIISAGDIADDTCRAVIEELYRQTEENGKAEIAELFNSFMDPESQKRFTGIINSNIRLEDAEKRNEAITDVVKRVKGAAIERRLSDPKDDNELLRLVEEKRKLQNYKYIKREGN